MSVMHQCPAPGCETRVSYDLLTCQQHWHVIPRPLRDALKSAWRAEDYDRHADVRSECVRVLEDRVHA